MSTFVAVGNDKKPFNRLLHAVGEIASRLPQPVIVQHGHTPFADERCRCVEFMGMEEFDRRIREAEIVILHAGAGSIMRAIQAGKVPVVVPRRRGEHVNDHQLELASQLETTGRVIVISDTDQLWAGVEEASDRQSRAVRGTSEPGASLIAAVADVLEGYAEKFRR